MRGARPSKGPRRVVQEAAMRADWSHIQELVERCAEIPGDFAELGVWQGTTFLPLARRAATLGKRAHAVDSFQGCGRPTERDRDPNGMLEYGFGALSVGGSRLFRQLVEPLPNVRIWEGYIPEVFTVMDAEVRALAFVHLDLDHYAPTAASLRWCWERMTPGGILCAHDYFPGMDWLASGAVIDWLQEIGLDGRGPDVVGILPSAHFWIKRGAHG